MWRQPSAGTGRSETLTSAKAVRISFSLPSPTSKQRMRPESITSGITLAMMRTAMKIDASGSKPDQPVYLMSMVEMMTPTLPSVSCSDERTPNLKDPTNSALPP